MSLANETKSWIALVYSCFVVQWLTMALDVLWKETNPVYSQTFQTICLYNVLLMLCRNLMSSNGVRRRRHILLTMCWSV